MTYANDGYEIVSGLDPSLVEGVTGVLSDALRRIGQDVIDGDLSSLILQREAQDHSLVYEASNFVGSSVAANRLVNAISAQVEALSGLSNLHVMPVTVAVQIPTDDRFDYKWHQESSFYPWAGDIINVWVPIQPVRVGTGTMVVVPGSHSKGPLPADHYMTNGTFRQIECAVDGESSEVPIEIDVGQYVIFDGNTVHRSDGNHGTLPRVVVIMRFIGADSLQKIRPLYKALSYET